MWISSRNHTPRKFQWRIKADLYFSWFNKNLHHQHSWSSLLKPLFITTVMKNPNYIYNFFSRKAPLDHSNYPLWFRLARETTGFCGIKYSGFLNPSLVYWDKKQLTERGHMTQDKVSKKAGCTGNVKDVLLRRASVAFPVVYKPARYYVWKICKQFVAAVC